MGDVKDPVALLISQIFPAFLFVAVLQSLLWSAEAHPGRPPLLDPAMARQLFHVAEINRTADGKLTKAEVADIFQAFDLDGDGQIEESEFTQHWMDKKLGHTSNAVFLFHHADTDRDGVLTSSPDLARVFVYFDQNGDGEVSEVEFVVTWVSLTS